MGTTVSAECECGYPDKIVLRYGPGNGGSLMVGSGMRGARLYFPALCQNCSEVVSVNLVYSPWRCPECKTAKVIPYFNETAHGDKNSEVVGTSCRLGLKDGTELEFCLYEDATYICPKCHEAKLKFEHRGHWD